MIISKIKLLFFFALFLLWSGCKSTPIPSGDRLVSVSWVNPTPMILHSLETRVGDGQPPVRLAQLPAYAEVATETDQPLFKYAWVKTQVMAGKGRIEVPAVQLEPPLRKSPDKEYNLRIQLRQGLPPVITLEPIRLTQERLSQSSN